MQYRQKTLPEPQCIGHPDTVYFFQLLLQGAPKKRKITAKITKNMRLEIPPFILPPIGHCGEKFNIGAQLHLFQYRMTSQVCVKVQALW